MPTEDRKPTRNEVATKVRDELEERRLFHEHYEVYVPDVVVKSGFGFATNRGGAQVHSIVVSLGVIVSWEQGRLAANQVNDLQDHLDAHWLGSGGELTLDHEDCWIAIEGEYTWERWTEKWRR